MNQNVSVCRKGLKDNFAKEQMWLFCVYDSLLSFIVFNCETYQSKCWLVKTYCKDISFFQIKQKDDYAQDQPHIILRLY